MWYLVCPNKGGRSYRLTQDKNKHHVGRTGGDIILQGDQSVSRRHAVFTFETDKDGKTRVKINDLSSKYGTYVNGSSRLDTKEPKILKDGDEVMFGCQWNEWRFHSKPLVVTTSTLPNETKSKLRRLISELGGTVVADWQESCSYLTMAEILLTAKVVNALASATPIVTPEYWEKFKEAIDGQTLPPNYDLFVPPLKESILNKNEVTFAVDERRTHLFNDKTFVFSSEKQLKKYKTIVVAAGGSCQTLMDCKMTVDELCGRDIIVMQHLNTDTQPPALYSTLLSKLREKGLRPIPESEIGLALLLISLNTHCNMKYNVVGNVLQGGIVMSQIKRAEILADDSQMSNNGLYTVKTEETDIQIEQVKGDTFSKTPVLSVMASSSLSSNGSGSLREWQNRETMPCDVDQASSQNEIPIDENASPSIAPGPSRKRPASVEFGEPPTKKGPFEGKAEELKKNNSYIMEDFTNSNGPSKSNQSSSGINEKGDTPYGVASKRKGDGIDSISKNDKPPKKSGRVQAFSSLFPSFGSVPSTSRIGCSSKLKIEDDDQWLKDGEKGIKMAVSSNWGDKFKELVSKRPGGLKDLGVGMSVKMANLVVDRDKQRGRKSPVYDPTVVNYKNFRKVKSVGNRDTLPVIIGGSDLVLHVGGGVKL